MTQDEIEKFISKNTEENVKYYFDRLIQNLQLIKNENYRIQIWMLLVVGIYFSIDFKILTELNLGPVRLTTDNKFVKLFTPLVFTYLLMQFATINSQRTLIIKNIRMFGSTIFNIERNIVESSMYSNSFLQLIMPFSISEEIYAKFMNNGKIGCITSLLTLPLFLIMFAPLYFEYLSIINLFDFWYDGWFDKSIIILTIWLILVIIGYYIKLIISSTKETNADFK